MVDLQYHLIEGSQSVAPVYMVHTIPLDSSYLLRSLKDYNFDPHLVLLDLPSHGQSADIKVEELSFEQMADAIEELRGKLNHPSIIIYGHGIGGFVAQHYAVKYQKNISGLILSNTAPNAKYRSDMAWNIRDRYSKSTKRALEGYVGKTDDKSIRTRFTQSLAVYFDPTDHDEAKKILDNCSRIASDAYVHLSQNEIPNFDIREQLRKLKIKTLILWGKKDVMPEKSSLLIKNDIIHARLDSLDTGHFPMIEKPHEYWSLINKWLQE
ncbi:MAG: alpha/beta fold hydrolase [Candidatus Kariarchaeaceae archaeon]|jgi:pimeloyl-ACP methyl ester carboxylesterase